MPFPPLLADWLQALGPLLLAVLWGAFQIIAAMREDKAAPRGKPGPRPIAPPGEAPAAGQGGVRTEVDEFLRRLGENQNKEAGVPAAPLDRAEQGRFAESLRRRKPKRRRPSRQEEGPRLEIVVEEEKPSKPLRQETSHQGRLNEERLSEHASHLGEKIAHTDDRLEARLHEKFDHRLGQLSTRQTATEPSQADRPEKPSTADRIKQMLASPAGVRDAILLQEVLNRPTDRW